MGKRKSVREKALSYARVFPKEMQHLARLAYESGHRANRISAAERRVVEAAIEYVTKIRAIEIGETNIDMRIAEVGRRKRLWDALENAALNLQRTKGGGNG